MSTGQVPALVAEDDFLDGYVRPDRPAASSILRQPVPERGFPRIVLVSRSASEGTVRCDYSYAFHGMSFTAINLTRLCRPRCGHDITGYLTRRSVAPVNNFDRQRLSVMISGCRSLRKLMDVCSRRYRRCAVSNPDGPDSHHIPASSVRPGG